MSVFFHLPDNLWFGLPFIRVVDQLIQNGGNNLSRNAVFVVYWSHIFFIFFSAFGQVSSKKVFYSSFYSQNL